MIGLAVEDVVDKARGPPFEAIGQQFGLSQQSFGLLLIDGQCFSEQRFGIRRLVDTEKE